MAITKTLRPGLVQIRVLDLDKTLDFYINILGLNEVCRTPDGRVHLKTPDEFDHHSVTLRLADEPGMDYFAMKVENAEVLEEIARDTVAFGYPVTEIPANSEQPGYGKQYKFTLCTGHEMHVYADVALSENGPMTKNPDPWVNPPRGMNVQRFDHLLLYGPNIEEAERYCHEVLGMWTCEKCDTPEGRRFAAWITGSNKAHDFAMVEYAQPGKVHHFGFQLLDWSALGNAADLMAKYNLKRDIGPTRHAITRGQTIYFWEPSGNRIETYTGGYTAYPDNPQRVWDFDQIARGLFYYEGEMIPSFLQVVT